MKHMQKTHAVLEKFAAQKTMKDISKGGNFRMTNLRSTPTTFTVKCGDDLLVSVSASGECRFYDGINIPGLAEIAIEEGKNMPLREAALAKTPRIPIVIPYRYNGPQTPIDHEIRARGDHEVIKHGSKTIVVPATAKYGQSNPTKHGTKYDKSATAENPSASKTFGKRKIRIRSDGGQSIKQELIRSGFTPVAEQLTEGAVIKSMNITKIRTPRPKQKKTKLGRMVSRDALARMEHIPCRVLIG